MIMKSEVAKAKAAGRAMKSIHSHDDSSDGSDLRKMRMDVVGTCRKCHVADV